MPSQAASARVRVAEGAPSLDALINGIPQSIGAAYLQVNGMTEVSELSYGTVSNFFDVPAGTSSLVARGLGGYSVGPVKTASLRAGARYTLVFVGSYPKYQVLTFTEPSGGSGAQMSLYEAAPSTPNAAYGRFRASSRADFMQLGTAKFGELSTVNLGKAVSDLGGYVGKAYCAKRGQPLPANCLTPSLLYSFDSKNVLPYESFGRLSLFLFDASSSSNTGPVFGSLDK